MIKNVLSKILMTCFLGLLLGNVYAQSWTYLGKPGFSPTGLKSVNQRIVIDEDNTIYVGFTDYGNWWKDQSSTPVDTPEGSLMKYDGENWVSVGKKYFTPGSTGNNAIALGGCDTVFFAFSDAKAGGFVRGKVMRYNGTEWAEISEHITDGQAAMINVVHTKKKELFYGSTDGARNAFVVKKYTGGTTWANVGPGTQVNASNEIVNFGYFEKDKHDSLWVVYTDVTKMGIMTVKKFNGTDWVTVGSPFIETEHVFTGGNRPISMTFDTNNVPYVAYCATFRGPPAVTVSKFDGTKWVLVGKSRFYPSVTTDVVIKVNPLTNEPYVAFHDQSKPKEAGVVMRFDKTEWKIVGKAGLIDDVSAFIDLAFDSYGNGYVVFEDLTKNYATSVMKFETCTLPEIAKVEADVALPCLGDEVELKVEGKLNSATEWHWYEGDCQGEYLGTGESIKVHPDAATKKYYVSGIGGCVMPIESVRCNISNICVEQEITTTSSADLGFGITVNDNILSTSVEFDKYQWILDDKIIPNATAQKFQVTQNGTYKVAVVNKGGCMDTSDKYVVNNASIEGIHTANISIYPNPAKSHILINAVVPVDIQIFSLDGKMVQQASNAKQVQLTQLTAGMYWVKVFDQSGALLKVEKVIKE